VSDSAAPASRTVGEAARSPTTTAANHPAVAPRVTGGDTVVEEAAEQQ
jgi:hypothetical protein